MYLHIRQTCLLLAPVIVLASMSVRISTAVEDPPQKELPPLVIDTDSPLMLEESAKAQKPNKKVAPSVAENAACFVCHENFSDEPLVTMHAQDDVGCVDCHGKSYAHRNDENNTTPPDVMFPRDKIEENCASCHDTHDAPAAQVIARLQERVPRRNVSQDIVCTQCHGYHKLGHRTVLWDRATGKLLTGSQDLPPEPARPTLEALKGLVGSWVLVGPDGKPTDKIVSTFRLTAGGTAVVQSQFPGEQQETLAVYHLDGDDLFLSHYSAAKGQPRMRCMPSRDPSVLQFEFVDATNMASAEDYHLRAGTIRIVDSTHIQCVWQAYDKGQPVGELKLDLLRKE